MEYISIKEAADRWQISLRLVQRWCTQGRIPGAQKFGRSWAIPSDADKPADLRRRSESPQTGTEALISMMPLMSTPFPLGQCRRVVEAMPDGPQKDMARAEYYYFSAQAEQAVQQAVPYLTSPDLGLRLSACWICGYAYLTTGQIQKAHQALGAVRHTLADGGELSPALRAAVSFTAAGAAVLLHLPMPEGLPPTRDFLPYLPTGLRAFALYVQAHALYLQEDYAKSVGMVEATLAMGGERYPIPAIYLHLAAVMGYMRLKQTGQAKEHLLAAWALARPDDLIEALGEHHGLLGGMLEATLQEDWPEDLRRILDVTYRFSWGWRRVHNPMTGHDVADNLTTTEFSVAMLVAQNWTNEDIAAHLHMSVTSVKRYLRTIQQKLQISGRHQLKQYMLQ